MLGTADIPEIAVTSPTAPGITHGWTSMTAFTEEVANTRLAANSFSSARVVKSRMPADDLSKLQHATAMARKRKGPSQGLLSAFQNEILTGLRVDVRANHGGALSMPVHSYRNDAEARGGVSRHPRRRL